MAITDQEIERTLAELRSRVRGGQVGSPVALAPLQRALGDVNANWFINTRMPPPDPRAPFVWRLVYHVKNLVRRPLAQVFNTLVEQQNTFNRNVARALTELAKENAMLRARIDELEKQIKKPYSKI